MVPEPVRWDWSGALTPGRALTVENPYGDVRARFGGREGKVEIHAVLQNLHPDVPPLEVLTEPCPGGLAIRVRRAGGSLEAPRTGPKDRADLVVRVPEGAPLTVRTGSGAIEAKGLHGDVTAESESGVIEIREVKGLVRTTNRYGATEVVLEAPPPGSEQAFGSLTGDLSVTLPAKADATVVARTSSWITTDISLDIVRRPREEPSKTATGRVGTGSARLLLDTKEGAVRIFQMAAVDDLAVGPRKPGSATPAADD